MKSQKIKKIVVNEGENLIIKARGGHDLIHEFTFDEIFNIVLNYKYYIRK
tara:strand:+ start:42 stop:191 length:150 start_codon:yes stop_codon:yes gene_type:complete